MAYEPASHHRRSIRLKGYDYALPGAYFVTIVTQGRARLFGQVIDGKMQLTPAGQMVQATWNELPLYYSGVGIDEFIVMPDHIHGIVILGDPSIGNANAHAHVGAGPRACPGGDPNLDGNATDGSPDGGPDGAPHIDRNTNPFVPGGDPGCLRHHGQIHIIDECPANDEGDIASSRGDIVESSVDGGSIDCRIPGNGRVATGAGTGACPYVPGLSLFDVVHRLKTMTTKRYTDGVKQRGWCSYRGRVWQRNYFERVIRSGKELDQTRRYISENPLRWKG